MAPSDQSTWAAQAAGTVERVVGTVRDRTTGPVLKVVRAIVFGFIAFILAVFAIAILTIVTIRVLGLIPGGIWVAYTIAGGLFFLAGLFFWSRRSKAAS